MTFRSALTGCLVHNLLAGLCLVALAAGIDATTSHTIGGVPDGVTECWNSDTAQITVVVGDCP